MLITIRETITLYSYTGRRSWWLNWLFECDI